MKPATMALKFAGMTGPPGGAPPSPGSVGLAVLRGAMGAESLDDSREVCRRDILCTDFKPEHRAQYAHPAYEKEGKRLACTFGMRCYRKNLDHLKEYVHPGDRQYREGTVVFGEFRGRKVLPEFPSIRDLFNFCDPDESGNISKDEFKDAWGHMKDLPANVFNDGSSAFSGNFEEAWAAATVTKGVTHLTFAMFAAWAKSVGLHLPVGMDIGTGAKQACRFENTDTKSGGKCPCQDFKAGATPNLCECGHKKSAHFSDAACMTVDEQEILIKLGQRGGGKAGLGGIKLKARRNGFDMVTDDAELASLQKILTQSHKTEDNWTRDRGCKIHGRNKCEAKCIFNNREPVPKGFKLVRAERNRNDTLWQTYTMTRSAIRDECQSESGKLSLFKPHSSLDIAGTEPLDPSINEWRLFHGTCLAACKGICGTNFNIKLAGTGASWEGLPLYGWGVYLAERSTKSDEYAEEITTGLPIDVGCHAVLLCRAVGGLSRLVETNEFDVHELRENIYDGPYHSVFGDRERVLNKPYKEVVVYNNNQIFPEYILYYKRVY